MTSFGEMFQEMRDAEAPPIPHEGQIHRLREYLDWYQAPNEFAVGDLVTPRRGVCVNGAGEPHIVLEILHFVAPIFLGNPGTTQFGMRLNVRIAQITSRGAACFWVEHQDLERYVEG